MRTVLEYLGLRRTPTSVPLTRAPIHLQVIFIVVLIAGFVALSLIWH